MENSIDVPIINISLLSQDFESKALAIKQIRKACKDFGCFTVINHGISGSLMEDVLDANSKFFDVPKEEKKVSMSSDVNKPIRFGTMVDEKGNRKFSREFLKLYAYPLADWIGSWPDTPSDYREKMGRYTMEVRKLGIQIFEAIMESLNLNATYWKHKFEQGFQMMGANLYKSHSQFNILSGIGPHTDHTIVTILLQGTSGLEIMDPIDGTWKTVPKPQGSLQVLVGDHLEALSNGIYKSVSHHATTNSGEIRLSVGSFHSFGMDEVVEPAKELVDEKHQRCYKGSSFRDYLKHLSSKGSKPFIEILKIG